MATIIYFLFVQEVVDAIATLLEKVNISIERNKSLRSDVVRSH